MPISVVQIAFNQITTAINKWDATFASPVTPGNVVVIVARLGTANRTIGAPEYTGGGGTFSSVVANANGSHGGLVMWSRVENQTGVTEYRSTIAASLTARGSITAYELSGASGATATASGTGTQATATTSPRMLDTGLDIPSGGIAIGAISTSFASDVSWGAFTSPASFTPTLSVNSGTGQASHFVGYRTASGTAVQGTATVATARAVYGIAAVWSEAATAYTLAADVGTLTLAGQAAGTSAAALLTADQGTLTVTGQAANTNAAAALAADFAALTLAGQAAALTVGATLPADAGALLFSGQDAALTVSIPITAGPLAVFQAQIGQPGPLAVQVDCPGPQAAQINQPGPLAVQL
jgi:hypothetical protein